MGLAQLAEPSSTNRVRFAASSKDPSATDFCCQGDGRDQRVGMAFPRIFSVFAILPSRVHTRRDFSPLLVHAQQGFSGTKAFECGRVRNVESIFITSSSFFPLPEIVQFYALSTARFDWLVT